MKKLLATLLIAGGSLFAADFSIGVNIGTPPPPRVVHVPASPGPGYVWVDGYWYANGGRWAWHNGYYTRPPYEGAHWAAPRYEGGRFFEGFWEGDRGRFAHDHRWDRDRNHDYNRYRDNDHDRDHDRH